MPSHGLGERTIATCCAPALHAPTHQSRISQRLCPPRYRFRGMWASPDDIGGAAFPGLPSHPEAFARVSFGVISRHPFQPQ